MLLRENNQLQGAESLYLSTINFSATETFPYEMVSIKKLRHATRREYLQCYDFTLMQKPSVSFKHNSSEVLWWCCFF